MVQDPTYADAAWPLPRLRYRLTDRGSDVAGQVVGRRWIVLWDGRRVGELTLVGERGLALADLALDNGDRLRWQANGMRNLPGSRHVREFVAAAVAGRVLFAPARMVVQAPGRYDWAVIGESEAFLTRLAGPPAGCTITAMVVPDDQVTAFRAAR